MQDAYLRTQPPSPVSAQEPAFAIERPHQMFFTMAWIDEIDEIHGWANLDGETEVAPVAFVTASIEELVEDVDRHAEETFKAGQAMAAPGQKAKRNDRSPPSTPRAAKKAMAAVQAEPLPSVSKTVRGLWIG